MIKQGADDSLFSRFLKIFLPLLVVSAALFYLIYSNEVSKASTIIKADEKSRVKIQKESIEEHIWTVIGDLRYFAKHRELIRLVNSGSDDYSGLVSDYLQLAKIRKIYDQIRFLDLKGQEIVRVNYNNGRPYSVLPEALQNKANRYYFSDTISLAQDEVFISPLDLNVERGEIEQPIKPVIRFGMSIYNSDQEKSGAIILNYLGSDFLANLSITQHADHQEMMLVNSQGYWLNSPIEQEEWGFMYEARKNAKFQNRLPDLWETMQTSISGQVEHETGLFTFSKVYPLKRNQINNSEKAYTWLLVSQVPTTTINAKKDEVLNILLVIFFYRIFFPLLYLIPHTQSFNMVNI